MGGPLLGNVVRRRGTPRRLENRDTRRTLYAGVPKTAARARRCGVYARRENGAVSTLSNGGRGNKGNGIQKTTTIKSRTNENDENASRCTDVTAVRFTAC